jgi:hypothetical protein
MKLGGGVDGKGLADVKSLETTLKLPPAS